MRLHFARITLEALSPLSIGSGDVGVTDVMLVRDAAGLPMIGGASLQGLIRTLADREGWRDVMDLLGKAPDKPETDESKRGGTAGRIRFSDARIHNSKGISITGADIPSDSLLKALCAESPLLRDHVALDHRGAGDDGKKFDRSAVPRGANFSLELSFWEKDESEGAAFAKLLQLFHHPLFRPGGARARGYGKVSATVSTRAWNAPFDAALSDNIADFRQKPSSDHSTMMLVESPKAFCQLKAKTLNLTPQGYWRLGHDGARMRTNIHQNQSANDRQEDTDAAFMREPRIENGALAKSPDFILPGSSLRGALAHRTLFHWNCMKGHFAESAKSDEEFKCFSKMPLELEALFGKAKTDKDGHRSALIVDDAIFTSDNTMALDHNSIDRFSGGVRTHVLFSEELAKGTVKDVGILIDLKHFEATLSDAAERDIVLTAFDAALNDLVNERLALGAKSSGWFREAA